MKPIKVTDAQLVFPADTSKHLPSYSGIPEEFQRGRTPWNKLVTRWFFKGLPVDAEFHPRDGIDANDAFRHIRYCMGSWEPKHEHKEAGCAYLLSQWFVRVKVGDEVYGERIPAPATEGERTS